MIDSLRSKRRLLEYSIQPKIRDVCKKNICNQSNTFITAHKI